MWSFKKKPAPEPEYRWSVEEKLERQVHRALHGENEQAYVRALMANRSAMSTAQAEMHARNVAALGAMQSATGCSRCNLDGRGQVFTETFRMPDLCTALYAASAAPGSLDGRGQVFDTASMPNLCTGAPLYEAGAIPRSPPN